MNTFFFLPLMAPPATEASGPASLITSFLPLIAIILIFYLLIIRPQNKKRKETEKMLAALKKGDRIVTIGGLHGTVHSVKDTTVIIKADDDVKLEFLRSAVSSVITASKEKIEDKSGETEGTSSESGE